MSINKTFLFHAVILLVFSLFFRLDSYAQPVLELNNNKTIQPLSNALQHYVVKSSNNNADHHLQSHNFTTTNGKIPVYPSYIEKVWLKFSVLNNTSDAVLYLDIQYTNLSEIKLFTEENVLQYSNIAGNDIALTQSVLPLSPDYIFELNVKPKETKTYYIQISSNHPIIFPAYVSTYRELQQNNTLQTLIIGLYFGVLLIMFLYNLFLFVSTYDKNYLFYIVYLLALAMAQIAASGYGFKFLWPHLTAVNFIAVPLTTTLTSITGILFTIQFLDTRKNFVNGHRILLTNVAIFIVGMLAGFFIDLHWIYDIINYNSLVAVITILTLSVLLIKSGYRPAYLYMIAWSFMLLSLITVILRNLSIVPYNLFTAYILYIGSMVEVALLSFALADKINVYKKEKEISQQQAIEALKENDRLIREQNIVLEKKVLERTEELRNANEQLNVAMVELKDAQTQLVESEKMASLGQLTAGIAHEINNPINFVKSNVKPLRMDIDDLLGVIDAYSALHTTTPDKMAEALKKIEQLKQQLDLDFIKTELDNLLKGIEDGAQRTAEIVRGLRTFSRLDESEIKAIDIHEGLDSTLVILKNSIPDYINIKKSYQVKTMVECFPGKLNQVFMNIINNAIHAIKDKKERNKEECIFISTSQPDDLHVEISIKDTGTGMTEEVKQKIFDPFFTTKDVGEGTGLGLAIVFKIIQKHQGKISVNTNLGDGTEFVITLPLSLDNY